MEKPIEVIILSGFLGAGKTTLLNHLLKNLKDKKSIVIENEFGEVPLDGSLLSKKYDQLYELSSGCICCTVGSELENVLSEIIIRKIEADYLFIETTGVADPGNVAAVFMQEEVQGYFRLNSTLCMVDAETVEDRINEVEEIRRQISFATDIILNKTGNVRADYSESLITMLKKLNPFASFYLSEDGSAPLDKLLTPKVFELNHEEYEHSDPTHCAHEHEHTHTHLHTDISSNTFNTAAPLLKNELIHILTVMLQLYGHQLYRIKGVAWFENEAQPSLVQSAGKYLSVVPMPIDDWAIQRSQLVFIGKGIKQESIERLLKPAISKKELDRY
jgi:G3E family GTPase